MGPMTVTGVAESMVLPLPSWPESLCPQHCTAPVLVTAQVCENPAASAVAKSLKPVTVTGVAEFVVLPLPSSL